jgi:hypothetical protein
VELIFDFVVWMKRCSIDVAALSQRRRYALYEDVTLEDRSNYHLLSRRPITNQGDNDTLINHRINIYIVTLPFFVDCSGR